MLALIGTYAELGLRLTTHTYAHLVRGRLANISKLSTSIHFTVYSKTTERNYHLQRSLVRQTLCTSMEKKETKHISRGN